MTKPTYWLEQRIYSEKVARGNQPWVWYPITEFNIHSIPVTKTEWRQLMQQIVTEVGEGTYIIYRTQMKKEGKGFRPVVYFQVLDDYRYRFIRRYTNTKAGPGKKPFFKEHIKHNSFDAPSISNVLNVVKL